MTWVIQDLPFHEVQTTVDVPGEHTPVEVRAYQIIIWVSVSTPGHSELSRETPRFPAILDVGHSHNFLIRQDHLERWGQVDLASLSPRRRIEVTDSRGEKDFVPLYDLDLWLHKNRKGKRDELAARPPFCLEIGGGIAVCRTGQGPRLPLLGLRALRRANLHVSLDCEHCRLSMRAPRFTASGNRTN